MGREGLEPSTNRLKAYCSTIELTAPIWQAGYDTRKMRHGSIQLFITGQAIRIVIAINLEWPLRPMENFLAFQNDRQAQDPDRAGDCRCIILGRNQVTNGHFDTGTCGNLALAGKQEADVVFQRQDQERRLTQR